METEKFELDEVLLNYLIEYMPEERRNQVLQIFDILDELNDLGTFNIAFDLEALEAECVDIIESNSDQPYDIIIDMLTVKFKYTFIDYLSVVGFTMDEDINFSQLKEMFNTIQIILTLDSESVDEAYTIITNQEQEPIEMICNLLDTYSPFTYLDFFNIIENVDDSLIDNLKDRFELIIFRNNPEIDENIKKIIERITNVDHNYYSTRIVNQAIQEGLSYDTIENNLKTLYSNLEILKNNVNMVPYEIVATFALSSDTRDNIFENFKENINLESITWIGEDTNKHLMINELVKDLASKVQQEARR
jgi:hypothetical protein